MALKITTLTTEVTTLKLDGRLLVKEAPELDRLYASLSGTIVIDLSGLLFADEAGIKVLTDLKAQGAQLIRARPYLSMLLHEPAQKPSHTES